MAIVGMGKLGLSALVGTSDCLPFGCWGADIGVAFRSRV
jgi:hypothetical protein